jgi:voltage-gated potassium channel
MFWVAAAYLLLLSGVLHLGVRDHHSAETPLDVRSLSSTVLLACGWGVALLHPLFLLEGIAHWRENGNCLRQHVWFCLFPPLRLGARDHGDGRAIWLPKIGWAVSGDELRGRVERGAGVPMIAVALLVLPLLAFEHFYEARISSDAWMKLFVDVSSGLIWVAFAFEFVVLCSIADRKVRYARQHWLDLLIILLPVIAFLRALRVARLARLGRAYRIRGTLLRAWRALLVLELVKRLVQPPPEKRLLQLREQLVAKEGELTTLKQEIEALERTLAQTCPREGSAPSVMG